MTPEQTEVLRTAGNWFDGRDGSHQELTNALLALRRAEARAASERVKESALRLRAIMAGREKV